ncbi:MAG: hypothetical protein RIC36_07220 [Rhodospirillales bacterium]
MQLCHFGRITRFSGALALLAVAGCTILPDSTRRLSELEAVEVSDLDDLKTAYKLCVVYNAISVDREQAPGSSSPSEAEATSAALEATSRCQRNYEMIGDYAFEHRLDYHARQQVTQGLTGEAIALAETSVNEVRTGEKPSYVVQVYDDIAASPSVMKLPGLLWDKFETNWKTLTPPQ